jgi:hypothetical protein
MKFNWRVLVALAVIVLTVFWVVDSVRSRSYSGTNLTFGVGRGPVTVTNSSDEPVPVQLVAAGTRTFNVSSTIDGVSGSSTRQGTGRDTTQLFELSSPSGMSEFTVARGTNVNFISNAATQLEAIVQPLSEGEARSTMIGAAVVVLAALFYIARTTRYNWMSSLSTRRLRPAS